MQFQPGNSQPGGSVELRAEMNVLVVLNTCQHPLDPNPHYAPKPVQLSISSVPAAGRDDACRLSRPEKRARIHLTETVLPLRAHMSGTRIVKAN